MTLVKITVITLLKMANNTERYQNFGRSKAVRNELMANGT